MLGAHCCRPDTDGPRAAWRLSDAGVWLTPARIKWQYQRPTSRSSAFVFLVSYSPLARQRTKNVLVRLAARRRRHTTQCERRKHCRTGADGETPSQRKGRTPTSCAAAHGRCRRLRAGLRLGGARGDSRRAACDVTKPIDWGEPRDVKTLKTTPGCNLKRLTASTRRASVPRRC